MEDPVGPSAFDPEGKGHRGIEAIAAFYDTVIAANESIRLHHRPVLLCGDEVANVGVIRITFAGGAAVEVDGIYIYARSPEGKIASLRAFWEPTPIRPSLSGRRARAALVVLPVGEAVLLVGPITAHSNIP